MDSSLKNQQQTTIKTQQEIEGVGLHTGRKCRVKLLPKDRGGIIFYRTDLKPIASIPALWNYNLEIDYHTALIKDGVKIRTTEHIMSALNALKIDNLSIELDSEELPILDGSAIIWLDLLKRSGTVKLNKLKKNFYIKKEIKVGDSNNYASILPYPKQKFDFFIDFKNPLIGKQFYSFLLETNQYKKIIAPCRTFGFEENIKELRSKKFIKGASLDNVLVLRNNGELLNKDGLISKNEFVKHKILDAIGDLYLSNYHIIGSYYGFKSSHKINLKLLQKIFI